MIHVFLINLLCVLYLQSYWLYHQSLSLKQLRIRICHKVIHTRFSLFFILSSKGDGIPDYLDDDDDNDGIPDHLDDDIDGDGIPDIEEEKLVDSDQDGIPDHLDDDDDNDGIPDHLDDDDDGDGIPDYLEKPSKGTR